MNTIQTLDVSLLCDAKDAQELEKFPDVPESVFESAGQPVQFNGFSASPYNKELFGFQVA